jgi:phage/plasmid-associated DNA primase
MLSFLEHILPDANMREYVLSILGSLLCGVIRQERFYIWTGDGKNQLVELCRKAFGEYCCDFPADLLYTVKKGEKKEREREKEEEEKEKDETSTEARRALVMAQGKRLAIVQEPPKEWDHTHMFDVGCMKELTGGEIIDNGITQYKPMYKMIMPCDRFLHVPSDDGGSWRRIRRIDFAPFESKISDEILTAWAPHFMSLLIESYARTRLNGLHEPDEVIRTSQSYQKENEKRNSSSTIQ